MNIGNRIKERRKALGMTVDDLAYEIGKNRTTVYRYENGNIENLPTSVLDPLAKALYTTPEYLIGWNDDPTDYDELINSDGGGIPNDFFPEINDPQERAKKWFNFKQAEYADYVPPFGYQPLTQIEEEHLKKYRCLDNRGRELVDMVLDKEYRYSTESPREFIMLEEAPLRPRYPRLASAGSGQYVFDDIPPELVEIDEDYVDSDFVISVNGDSMEPTYHDYDDLIIKKQPKVSIGEIGIFMINGEAFVKEFKGDRLHSHNPNYADIILNENMDIRCIGKVIGKRELK